MQFVSLLLLFAGHFSQGSAQDQPGLANENIFVIRHAEKPESGPELAPMGEKRAQAYVDYFKTFKYNGQVVLFSKLFATADSKSSARERLTLAPLSKALGEELDMRFKNKDVDDLANDIKQHHYGNILICWHHGQIPNLLTALGADSEKLIPGNKWPDATFDWVIELSYDSHGHLASETQIKEQLPLQAS